MKVKSIFINIVALLWTISGLAVAQINLDQKLPADPKVKIGKLENGLTYYIRTNHKPENRAFLRLVVNAGSVLEDDDQQGLAHFIEHMAFNGTKNFRKHEIIDYLESVGMRFGPEINAFTSFDETVYMLEIPLDSLAILETGIRILSDWAQNISFEQEEIDKERGVIVEEWRLGRGALARMADKQYPVIFKDSKYAERLPIGKVDIIENAKRETLIRFYNDWYKPDLMAVVAVGDFNEMEIEEIVIRYFSSITFRSVQKERPEFIVPDFSGARFAIASDKEATLTAFQLYFMKDKEVRMNVGDYLDMLIERMYHRMFNERLAELRRSPDPPFVNAYSGMTSLVRNKSAYSLSAIVEENGIDKGLKSLLLEAKRVKEFGFTATELERQKKNMGRSMQKYFAERENRESNRYASAYVGNFLNDSPILSVEDEYNLFKELVERISLEDVNTLAKELITEDNRVVVVSSPDREDINIPTQEELDEVIATAADENVTAFIDNISSGQLVDDILTPEEIVSEKEYADVGISELELENGVKVLLKPTDFKNDEVLFSASSPGGNSLVSDDKFVSAIAAPVIVNESGLGNFTFTELRKLLAGKVISVFPWISELQEGFEGTGTPDDLETLLQLVYLYFTSTRKDSTAYQSFMNRIGAFLQNRSASPDAAFQDTITVTLTNYNYRTRPWKKEMLKEINFDDAYDIFKERFKDAGDFTFIFVGAFNLEQIKPLIQLYLGNLPSTGRVETWKDVGINYPKGAIKKEVRKGIEPKSKVMLKFTGDIEWTRENVYYTNSLADYLDIKLREVIREDKSGTYGINVWCDPSHFPKENYSFSITFGCDPDRVEELTGEIFLQLDSLYNYEPETSYINKVKEMQLRKHETDLKTNGFWLYYINDCLFNNADLTSVLNFESNVNLLTPEIIKAKAKHYLNPNNYVEVVLYPE